MGINYNMAWGKYPIIQCANSWTRLHAQTICCESVSLTAHISVDWSAYSNLGAQQPNSPLSCWGHGENAAPLDFPRDIAIGFRIVGLPTHQCGQLSLLHPQKGRDHLLLPAQGHKLQPLVKSGSASRDNTKPVLQHWHGSISPSPSQIVPHKCRT